MLVFNCMWWKGRAIGGKCLKISTSVNNEKKLRHTEVDQDETIINMHTKYKTEFIIKTNYYSNIDFIFSFSEKG